MTTFEVKLQQFTGPLEKLLGLIEAQQLEISQISIAAVTGDYLDYIKKLENEISSSVLSDFLVIASKLLLIKSKILIPDLALTSEEEEEILDLETRLKLFREFKAVSQHIQNLWSHHQRIYAREFLSGITLGANFYPPKTLSQNDLYVSAKALLSVFENFLSQSKEIKVKSVSLEEKMKELLERITEKITINFSEIGKSRPRGEIIVLFLAVLHLLRDRLIKAEQGGRFGEIKVEKFN